MSDTPKDSTLTNERIAQIFYPMSTATDNQKLIAIGIGRAIERIVESRYKATASALTVWYGSMPESNGKTNWTAILHRGDISEGFTIDRSEYPDRVRYEADRVRYLIGETEKEPWILDYDADKHSGYVPRASPATAVLTDEQKAAIGRIEYFLKAWEFNGVGKTIKTVQDSPDSCAAIDVADLRALASMGGSQP